MQIAQGRRRIQVSFDQARSRVTFAVPELVHDRPSRQAALDGEYPTVDLPDLEDLW